MVYGGLQCCKACMNKCLNAGRFLIVTDFNSRLFYGRDENGIAIQPYFSERISVTNICRLFTAGVKSVLLVTKMSICKIFFFILFLIILYDLSDYFGTTDWITS